jgi:hypothetical protein
MKNWAARLSAPDEPLTLDEARTLAAIAAADRLLEVRDTLSDVQMRLQRIELFLGVVAPGYDTTTRALAAQLVAGKHR